MEKKVYIGYNKNNEVLKKCASGGVATTIAKEFVKTGGIVISVGYSSNFHWSEFYVAKSESDIERLSGSKYVFSRKIVQVENRYESLLEVIKRLYHLSEKIMFIGLPCECNMIKQFFLKNNMELGNIVLVDLICQGTMPEIAHNKFINDLENKYNSSLVELNVKMTVDDWRKPQFWARFKNGKIYKKNLYSTDYGLFFYLFSRKACYFCKFKGDNRASDITIGDFWSTEYEVDNINKYGTSVLIPHSDKGSLIINNISKSSFYLKCVSEKKALKNNPMYYFCRNKRKGWENVEASIKEDSIRHILKKSLGIPKYYILKIINSNLLNH